MACMNLLVSSFLIAFIARTETFCIEDEFLRKDFSLRRTSFTYFNHSDIYRCASSCLLTPLCRSFHIEIDSRLCVLFHRNSSQVGLISKQGVIFSDISLWPQGLKGDCNSKDCSNNRRCVPSRRDGFKCDHLNLVDVFKNRNKFYRVITAKRNWHKADEYCQKHGGQLWVMTTQRELNFLQTLLLDADRIDQLYWVGVSRTATGWRWLNGDYSTPDQWAASEPKWDGNCAVYGFGSGLFAKDGTEEWRSICEHNGSS